MRLLLRVRVVGFGTARCFINFGTRHLWAYVFLFFIFYRALGGHWSRLILTFRCDSVTKPHFSIPFDTGFIIFPVLPELLSLHFRSLFIYSAPSVENSVVYSIHIDIWMLTRSLLSRFLFEFNVSNMTFHYFIYMWKRLKTFIPQSPIGSVHIPFRMNIQREPSELF